MLREMNFDETTPKVTLASWEDYLVKDKEKLHSLLPIIANKDYYSPDYFIWRNFLYRYLQANVDKFATDGFMETIQLKEERINDFNNSTSYTANATLTAMRTVSTPIFDGITRAQIDTLIDCLKIVIDDANDFGKTIRDNKLFFDIASEMLLSDDLSQYYAVFRVYVLRKRTLGFRDKRLEEMIAPKFALWAETLITSFDELSAIIGDDNTLFEFYTPGVRTVITRMLKASYEFLLGSTIEFTPILEIYGKELSEFNSITGDSLKDLIESTPLYEAAVFEPITVYNLLYMFLIDTSCEHYNDMLNIFAVGTRLYNAALRKLVSVYKYLTDTNIGKECITLMDLYLSNLNISQEEYSANMHEYLEDLYDRGLINAIELEEKINEIKQFVTDM